MFIIIINKRQYRRRLPDYKFKVLKWTVNLTGWRSISLSWSHAFHARIQDYTLLRIAQVSVYILYQTYVLSTSEKCCDFHVFWRFVTKKFHMNDNKQEWINSKNDLVSAILNLGFPFSVF